MNIKQYIVLFSAVIAFVGCKKVELEPTTPSTSPSPVFTAAINVNGESNLIEVGGNANLSTYHRMVGESSYVGTTFSNLSGDDLLSFEFGFFGPLSQSSFTSPVDFGSLRCNHELDILNVESTLPIVSYTWNVNGEQYIDMNVPLTEYDEYDISLDVLLSNGAQVQLKDRLILGGLEIYEPEIVFVEVSPYEFVFSPLNYSSDIDSIRWEIQSPFDSTTLTSNEVNFHTLIPFLSESFVVTCYYYVDGMENYISEMHSISASQSVPIVNLGSSIFSIQNLSFPASTRGKVSYNYNGDLYTTDDGQISTFQLNNIQQFTDEYTAETYIKGSILFSSYLHNSFGDSIYVEVDSEIGFSDMPD